MQTPKNNVISKLWTAKSGYECAVVVHESALYGYVKIPADSIILRKNTKEDMAAISTCMAPAFVGKLNIPPKIFNWDVVGDAGFDNIEDAAAFCEQSAQMMEACERKSKLKRIK